MTAVAFHWAGSVWEYDSTHDSIIAIGNGGTKPAEAAFILTYNHGTGAYEIDQLLQPDQQMWIDVGQLIRSQVPDKNGVVLPVALSMGSYEIRQLNHRGPGTLFEGKVIYDKKYGSVTYGCSTCCGYTASQFEFSYDPLGIPLDGEEDQEVEGYDTCYGEFVNVTSDFDSSWSTANHAIATVNAYGVHKGVAIGKTTTNASAREQIFNERQDCPIEPVYPTGPDNVVGINSVSPNPVVIGTYGTMTISGSGLSGKGTPTVQFSGGGITPSNVNVVSDTEVTLSYNVSCSAPSQQVSLTFPSFDNLTTNSLSVTVGLPTAPTPGISFGGNNVTNTTQSVVVGQQIALTASVPSLPACMSLSSQSWSTPPGTANGGYTSSLDSAQVTALPANNASSYTFYWAAAANSMKMTYQYVMSSGGGGVNSPAATATFNVAGPTGVTVLTPTGEVVVPSGQNTLVFGGSLGNLGIQFNGSATPPSGDSGEFFYTQIISTYNAVYTDTPGCSTSLGTGLDNSVMYGDQTGLVANDNPYIPLFSNDTEATANFSATMYLMWQSGTSGSIPVPLGNVTWQWSGDAVQSSGVWSLKSGTGSSDGFVASPTYPQWSTYVTNGPVPCH